MGTRYCFPMAGFLIRTPKKERRVLVTTSTYTTGRSLRIPSGCRNSTAFRFTVTVASVPIGRDAGGPPIHCRPLRPLDAGPYPLGLTRSRVCQWSQIDGLCWFGDGSTVRLVMAGPVVTGVACCTYSRKPPDFKLVWIVDYPPRRLVIVGG